MKPDPVSSAVTVERIEALRERQPVFGKRNHEITKWAGA
jgi:hypothetical protein